MDKDILTHRNLIAERLKLINNMSPTTQQAAIRELYKFHITRVKDFQHERLVHLVVTLFFAGLLISSVIGVITTSFLSLPSDQGSLLYLLLSLLSILLLVVTLFYVWHYFKLENRTQKLYPLTNELYLLLDPSCK